MGETVTATWIARNLASSDKLTRNKSLRSLAKLLESHVEITDEELKWIWKGLFYCIWHADKQVVQVELITLLSSFLVCSELSVSIRYFEVFLATIRREWSGIDHLRLDKFYLLIRKFICNLFVLLKNNSWNPEVSTNFMNVLIEEVFLAADKHPAQGISYHVADIFLQELKDFIPLRTESLDILLTPFLLAMSRTRDKVLLNRIKANVFIELLENGKKYLSEKKSGNIDLSSVVENFGTITFAMGFAKRFFALASAPETVQHSRKVLFALHKDFLRLENNMKKFCIVLTSPSTITQRPESESDDKQKLVPDNDSKHFEVKAESEISGKSLDGTCDATEQSEQLTVEENNKDLEGNYVEANDLEEPLGNAEDEITLDESVISNLQKKFEKVAAEGGMDLVDVTLCPRQEASESISTPKKRKRSRNRKGLSELQISHCSGSPDEATPQNEDEGMEDKSIKKVRFVMKNNLVWRPHNPLPPQSLRLPPSATPRGSALKKGVPAGPISATPVKKMRRKVNSAKKGRKTPKSVSSSIKKLRKLQTLSV